MRITEEQKNAIIEAVKNCDPSARVWLFGSRADNSKKGGDIDIAILSETINKDVMQTIQVRRFICDRIGEQKLDIVTSADGQEAFFRMARGKGIELETTKDTVEIFKENLSAVNSSLKRLMYSHEICTKIGLKDIYSEEEFAAFEAMTSRYARTTDMLISKLLRSLDTVEYIDDGTVIDAVNNAEKRGLAEAQDLRKLKDLRNSIAHEYVTENITRFFNRVLLFSPILKTIIDNLNNYSAKYLEKTDN